MTVINVWDSDGLLVNELFIDDKLTYLNGRVSKGVKYYYKGVGIPYHSHYRLDDINNKYEKIKKPSVFYLGYNVIKKSFVGKIGIFHEKYQPQFTDFIGTCGSKELSIIEHSEEFERSSVNVIKAECHDNLNHQYYFVVNYKCGRVGYTKVGQPRDLYALLEYMIQNDWNFIWDKNSITDISYNGLVTDVADIFRSTLLKHKLGTVYSVLHSLAKTDFDKYLQFVRYIKNKHEHQIHFVMIAIQLLRSFGVDTNELEVSNDLIENYKHSVMNYIIEGRNCGHCCYIELGNQITDEYRVITKKQLGI